MQDSLAGRLKYARKARGWTQEKLSAESGVKQSDISKIERGDTLRPTGLLALATALRCNPYWLETGDGVWDAAVALVPPGGAPSLPSNVEEHASRVAGTPSIQNALPVVLDAIAASPARSELRQLLPMLVDTGADAYKRRLFELLVEFKTDDDPADQVPTVNPAFQEKLNAEVRYAEERKLNEQKHGHQSPKTGTSGASHR